MHNSLLSIFLPLLRGGYRWGADSVTRQKPLNARKEVPQPPLYPLLGKEGNSCCLLFLYLCKGLFGEGEQFFSGISSSKWLADLRSLLPWWEKVRMRGLNDLSS
ncbi:MAG: hypothetical protein OEZ51_09570, partial [Nitrospinota bacterium]|nr:hypothetical protein [Nitrospinota bacterium]